MKEFFEELFEYTHRMNQDVISELEKITAGAVPKSLELMSHILNAQQIWNSRIDTRQTPFGVWQVHPLQDFAAINKQNYESSLYILGHFDLSSPVTYTNSRGDTFTNTVRDILFHANNHANYHRAQIATDMKQAGFKPVVTDYIFYKR